MSKVWLQLAGKRFLRFRGVRLGYWVIFMLDVSGRFEIGMCPYCILDNCKSFLSRVKSASVIRSGKFRIIEFVLNTSRRE